MRLLFVADGRSPIALNWIQYFIQGGHEVHLVSTYPCNPPLSFASCEILPVAFSSLKSASPVSGSRNTPRSSSWQHRFFSVRFRTAIRQWLGLVTLPAAGKRLSQAIERLQPDLVHAMRIPYEGMLAALAQPQQPLIVSVWGNDFTLHANSTPWMGYFTRLAVSRTSALHADCQRDIWVASQWGLKSNVPTIVLPGSGGVQSEIFYPPQKLEEKPVAINPRGFRAYVRNDTFFQAIPLILRALPQARFICPGMEGETQALFWLKKLGIEREVSLLPPLPRSQMGDLFRQAQVMISPSTHDGTPNTFLEAIACGCFPVVGDLDSLREWVQPGENGFLFDPTDPQALAQVVLEVFSDASLRSKAALINQQMIAERADYGTVMEKAEQFYRSLQKNPH